MGFAAQKAGRGGLRLVSVLVLSGCHHKGSPTRRLKMMGTYRLALRSPNSGVSTACWP